MAAAASSLEQQIVPASPAPPAAQTASPTPTNTTKWPNAAPLDGEKLIFSISCGNSHLHWATHFGEAEDYNPQIFWRTPHLKKEDMESEDLLAVLSRNLPDDPHDYIFGKAVDATTADAISQSKLRAAPLISVYVVSTNQSQEALLAAVWKTVPSRFYVMRGDDFFSEAEGRYDTMGTDRLATLTGAVHLHGHPALVFDGGTATTYSATDGDGKILGGGIGPGLQSKFRSLTKDTDALPMITAEEVIARVNEAQEKEKPLPTFARNTQEAMIVDAFQEFALKGRHVIGKWLEKAKEKSTDKPTKTMKVNTDMHVICTGGDSDILMQLLQPHYGGIIEHMESKSKKGALAYKVEMSKHLIHYGIACVLAAQVSLRKLKDAFRKNPYEEHVGKRVAKNFGVVESDDGNNVFRGEVIKVIDNDGHDEFRIQYDDGDSEDVAIGELYDLFEMFAVHGEKKSKKPATGKGKSTSQKKRSAPQKEKKEKKKEKPTPQAATQNEKATAQTATSDKENTEDVKLSSEKKAVDIPSFPIKPVRNRASKTPSDAKKPAAKKPKTVNDIVAVVNSSDPRSFVRKRVAKDFDGESYFGTIMEYDDAETPAFWKVEYDDGDQEDYSKKDLIKALKYYGKEEKNDPNKS